MSFAWNTLTTKNGAQTEQEMRRRIERYKRISPAFGEDYETGCILLLSPFFFPEDEWIPASDWEPNIVQGRSYDTTDLRGESLCEQVKARLKADKALTVQFEEASEAVERFGAPQLVRARLGQGTFRVVVTDAYSRRCAFTGSPVLHVLDAAHIRPFTQDGPHDLRNGILLRQDVHTLFDRGYITVTPEYRVEVSHRIKEEFANGQEYYSQHGKTIDLPKEATSRPSSEFLSWHNENVYLD